ncbi:glutamate 5-kinase [Anditalea andensis]|uniref:Glutamate 5-kinase n=1 Tax=Anditalea andensis TaxID=1048983 RepID=A0A074LNM5_9BACT|nr:glutamate 5-kinase [Anditalea andensis]KEO75517.1 gamma-glutamyl kinase [Anditalea andensis]
MSADLKRIVIKIGSNVLTQNDGTPDRIRMAALVEQITYLRQKGLQVIIISSGAVAFGRAAVPFPEKADPVVKRQILAAIGQIELIHSYQSLFSKHDINVAQLMVTQSDFRDRKHYLNMKNCFEGLLHKDIIPIVNENDTVAVTELMFTDNDELAGLVAAMADADRLILLSNVAGIYKGHPDEPGAELIRTVDQKSPQDLNQYILSHKSSFGRGGMLTKINMAMKSADLGIGVYIANGKKDNVLVELFDNTLACTYFIPNKAKESPKKWIAHSDSYSKGTVIINEGAEKALFSEKIISLLPIGITEVSGEFTKGDIIRILSPKGIKLGLGKAAYGYKSALEKKGLKNQKPIIHYDYLYLFDH